MEVHLLNQPDKRFAEKAAAICIGKEPDYIDCSHLKAAIAGNHLSILEHISLTFEVDDISRACLAQLTRHRHVSFSVQSQRYVKLDSNNYHWMTIPNSILDNTTAYNWVISIRDGIRDTYNRLIELGIPLEDARMVLPNATRTNLIMSMNARAFVEICQKRLCNRAQEEIKMLFLHAKGCLDKLLPDYILDLCNPPCKLPGGCREKHPCNIATQEGEEGG